MATWLSLVIVYHTSPPPLSVAAVQPRRGQWAKIEASAFKNRHHSASSCWNKPLFWAFLFTGKRPWDQAIWDLGLEQPWAEEVQAFAGLPCSRVMSATQHLLLQHTGQCCCCPLPEGSSSRPNIIPYTELGRNASLSPFKPWCKPPCLPTGPDRISSAWYGHKGKMLKSLHEMLDFQETNFKHLVIAL